MTLSARTAALGDVPPTGTLLNLRLIDWIWNIRGSLPLAPRQSGEEAFGKLDPLFHQPGTSHERTGDTLTFRKKDQAAQDRMAVFDGGVLRIERGEAGLVLRYEMASRILLFCFLAPLLFLSFGAMTVAAGLLEGPPTEKADDAGKPEKAERKLHPIDVALGAPAPEKPKKDDKKEDSKHSPTPAYVFAGLFAALYVAGRILEARLAKALFRKSLDNPAAGAG